MNARRRGNLSAVVDPVETLTELEERQGDQAEAVDTDQAAADSTTETAQPAPVKKTRSPRKKSAAAPAKDAPKQTTTPAPKTAPRKAAAKKAAPAKPAPKPAPEPVRVLAASSDDAKRVSLYLHVDDFKALGMAKLEDGIELNSRVRAMIALYRHSERYRNAVDKAAKTAPRGGM